MSEPSSEWGLSLWLLSLSNWRTRSRQRRRCSTAVLPEHPASGEDWGPAHLAKCARWTWGLTDHCSRGIAGAPGRLCPLACRDGKGFSGLPGWVHSREWKEEGSLTLRSYLVVAVRSGQLRCVPVAESLGSTQGNQYCQCSVTMRTC